MPELKIQILAYIDNYQPGIVRCSFTDAKGKEWFIKEKVPIVSNEDLHENSDYPKDTTIRCVIIETAMEGNLITIDLDKPWGISAENGETIFTVLKDQIINPES